MSQESRHEVYRFFCWFSHVFFIFSMEPSPKSRKTLFFLLFFGIFHEFFWISLNLLTYILKKKRAFYLDFEAMWCKIYCKLQCFLYFILGKQHPCEHPFWYIYMYMYMYMYIYICHQTQPEHGQWFCRISRGKVSGPGPDSCPTRLKRETGDFPMGFHIYF